MDEEDLEFLCSPYGKVTSAEAVYHNDGVRERLGFVYFSCREEAERAINSHNGTAVVGAVLSVALAKSREECLRELQSCSEQYTERPFHPSCRDITVPQDTPPFLIHALAHPSQSYLRTLARV